MGGAPPKRATLHSSGSEEKAKPKENCDNVAKRNLVNKYRNAVPEKKAQGKQHVEEDYIRALHQEASTRKK